MKRRGRESEKYGEDVEMEGEEDTAYSSKGKKPERNRTSSDKSRTRVQEEEPATSWRRRRKKC